MRQDDWREELFKTSIRGESRQPLAFSRLEPLPGTRWLQAEGENRKGESEERVGGEEGSTNGPERVVVSFRPDHALLEQYQVAHAIEEAQALVPRPGVIIFAGFQFDPKASKDIDETKWPGGRTSEGAYELGLVDSGPEEKAGKQRALLAGRTTGHCCRAAHGKCEPG